jgi:hypothetical protein
MEDNKLFGVEMNSFVSHIPQSKHTKTRRKELTLTRVSVVGSLITSNAVCLDCAVCVLWKVQVCSYSPLKRLHAVYWFGGSPLLHLPASAAHMPVYQQIKPLRAALHPLDGGTSATDREVG